MAYLVDGDQHCFTPISVVYTADATGDMGGGAGASMIQWVSEVPLAEGASISTICDGSIESVQGAPNNVTYCSSGVYPKTYVEHYV